MKLGIRANLTNQLNGYLGELAYHIDQFLAEKCRYDFSTYEWLRTTGVKHQAAQQIADYYKKTILPELLAAKQGECDQLSEAYSFLSASEMNRYINFVSSIVEDCEKWSGVSRQISLNNKSPRPFRRRSPLKQVAKLNYLRSHENLTSVPPTRVVGAKYAWTYNIKTKLLGVYVCRNSQGLAVRGTTLVNFDIEQSVGKVLRKPETTLAELLESQKLNPKKFLDNLTTKEKRLTGRINGDTLLLRVA